MRKALVVIDYTNDFVHEKGALTCGEPGQEIEDSILELMETFRKEKEFIVQAVDVHTPNDPYHPETKLFPTHNVRDTWGRQLYGKVKELHEQMAEENEDGQIYYMDKTRYSAFAYTDLEAKLREREITEIHLTGVCTDICVLHTAIDAYNKGFSIVIHEKAVASFNEPAHQLALQHFENVLNAVIINGE
ncbi:cysteine hydrolase [Bacillus salacetis]|uniref:Cysteine hydrolase n=1 Tax=Bacillus salacetis TaxID=2315464 RepID=A0A3A1QSM4_9BACI|nr:isochorismatase family cysteine hydrolase [Bacillus salacetis]RIW30394.1 cysteine hydrolase [Bacillus salacetis]